MSSKKFNELLKNPFKAVTFQDYMKCTSPEAGVSAGLALSLYLSAIEIVFNIFGVSVNGTPAGAYYLRSKSGSQVGRTSSTP